MQSQSLDEIALFLKRLQWAALGLGALWLLWLLAPILTPFVLSLMLGWLGDPLVDRLQRRGLSRNTAVALVFTLMALVVLVALLILVPLIQNQIATLAASMPSYRDWFTGTALPWVERRTGFEISDWLDLEHMVALVRDNWERAGGFASTLLGYLQKLAVVRRITPVRATPQGLEYELELVSGLPGFNRMLDKGGVVQTLEGLEGQPPVYQLR